MTKAKTTKRALLMSVLSMVLCCAMLVGSTFAWFTDSVTSGKNKIVAGNLDVEVTHTNKDAKDQPLQDAGNLFPVTLWEPGVVSYETFTVTNKGTLAFNYEFNFKANDCNYVKLADGTETELSLKDVIQIGVIEGGVEGKTREQLITEVKAVEEVEGSPAMNFVPFKDVNFVDYMQTAEKDGNPAQSEKTFTVVAYWAPNANDVDNLYNVNNGKTVDKPNGDENQLYIDIVVDVHANQRAYESDSFDNQYDADAFFSGTEIDSLRDKLSTAKAGDVITVNLTRNASVDERITVPKGVTLKLNGNGHTIQANTTDYAIFVSETDAEISNVTFTGTAKAAVLSFANYNDPSSKCNITLTNVTVNLESCSQYPIYFHSRADITMNNCTVNGAGAPKNPAGAHIFAGAEISLTVNGGTLGYVVMNKNDMAGSKLTLNGGTIKKLNFADANNINGEGRFTNIDGTVNEYAGAAETQ